MTHPPASSPDWKDWLAALRRVLGIAARYRNTTPKNPGRAIHVYRARIKEARALFRLAPPSLRTAAKTCRDELARASRTLSAARDAVVVTETVRELIRQNHKLDPGSLPLNFWVTQREARIGIALCSNRQAPTPTASEPGYPHGPNRRKPPTSSPRVRREPFAGRENRYRRVFGKQHRKRCMIFGRRSSSVITNLPS